MKLSVVDIDHIKQAAKLIDEQGIPKNYVWSQYYVVVKDKEYPFKYLTKTAYYISTNKELEFQSNDSYRRYIESLGFQFTYYEGGYNFFTKHELEFYTSIVNTDYRVANPLHNYYRQKLYPIIAKAKYWAEQIKPDNFHIKQDGNWLNGHVAKIKPYFWPRVYSEEDNDVFFNVEVNGSKEFIGYKLDGYFETTKALPEHKIRLLQEYKTLINWEWPQISFEKLHEYNWEKLLKESREYIQKYLEPHNHLKKLLSKESKIARITWNTNSWIKPSGNSGKSTNPSFEFENGFGHEEWLFDGDKIIDGYKYGFLEPIHKYRSKYEGEIFDISLYTRDSESNQIFWVANLKDVEVLYPEKSDEVLKKYKSEGWFNEMKEDLYNLNLDPNQLDIWINQGPENLFNIRFKANQLNEIPNVLIPVQSKDDIPSNRYTLMDVTSQTQINFEQGNKTGFSFADSGSENSDLETRSKRKGQISEIELELKHNILQTKFLQFLQARYGKAVVRRECTAFGASRIDIARKTTTGYIFYEIKTYNSLKTSIREAIGQLLEYCLYPNVNEAEQMVIVSHVPPSPEMKEYINHIKKFITIPFFYIHFDLDKEEIISEI